MKTFSNKSRLVSPYFLMLIILIAAFGMNLTLHAQSPVMGNDFERVNNSMKIQMNKQDFDVLIPKVKMIELVTFSDAAYNQLVYVTDEKPGFYTFSNNEWTKQSVRFVLAAIEMNIQMEIPSMNNILIEATNHEAKQMLDYNSYISNLYYGFNFEEGSNEMAVFIK